MARELMLNPDDLIRNASGSGAAAIASRLAVFGMSTDTADLLRGIGGCIAPAQLIFFIN